MVSLREVTSLVMVGALWGCTNPLLRKGSTEVDIEATSTEAQTSSTASKIRTALAKFRRVSVWLPFLVNQLGSLLFYITLSSSDLSLAVPTCNALALIFSLASSYLLGERVDKPWRTIAGSALVMGGVALCLYSRSDNDNNIAELDANSKAEL
jgi:drug/metabolite transporter (DMT)-like permease